MTESEPPKARETVARKTAASPARKDATPEERSLGAAMMGSARTDAKRAAARENGRKNTTPGPGRTPRPIEEIPCTCGRGDTLEGHPQTCPRGLAISRRKKAGTL